MTSVTAIFVQWGTTSIQSHLYSGDKGDVIAKCKVYKHLPCQNMMCSLKEFE